MVTVISGTLSRSLENQPTWHLPRVGGRERGIGRSCFCVVSVLRDESTRVKPGRPGARWQRPGRRAALSEQRGQPLGRPADRHARQAHRAQAENLKRETRMRAALRCRDTKHAGQGLCGPAAPPWASPAASQWL